ncbi:MAG: response regulator [Treponema sp.]|nr:response regulator [Treponema sp.]
MKQVLIIDASPLFREFLKEKLTAERVGVEIVHGRRDAFTKLISLLPDLVILDINEDFDDLIDFLQKKQKDPNAKSIPMIIAGPLIAREKVATLGQFNVVKYFTKPIKFDIFFESIGRILRAGFSIDVTPCMLEIHLNHNIIFIEIAQGLNREKIALLKYKLSEIIDTKRLENPKIILMMTDLSLSFIDCSNLELLFDNIIADERIQKKNVKVLSLDKFTRDIIAGHPQYTGIEVVTNLSHVLNSLIDSDPSATVTDMISDRILASSETDADQGSVEMRFYSDSGVINKDEDHGTMLTVAIVDDDAVIRSMLKAAFATIGAECKLFDSGSEFISANNKFRYDLIILDIYMPGISGFEILKKLHQNPDSPPVIIYSQATQRQAVIQALSMGAKSYLVKPQKPEAIINKAIEVLHAKI